MKVAAAFLTGSLLVLAACAEGRDERGRPAAPMSDAAVTPSARPSPDGSIDASTSLETSDGSVPPICRLTADTALAMKALTCRIRLAQPPSSSAIYQSLTELEAGVVDSAQRCEDNPLAWYRDGTTSPTNVIACAAACERSGNLFPSFVASIRPLAGCTDPKVVRWLCSLPEFSFLGISESSCALPTARPEDRALAYKAAEMRGAEIVASYDDCASHPLAMFPNDRTNPTQLVACDGACALSDGLFPAFVAATWSLLGCDGDVGER